jgi:hypothetical protein
MLVEVDATMRKLGVQNPAQWTDAFVSGIVVR